MGNPIVSIIVPVYNVEKYIRKCMDSLVGQTYKEIEIITVLDGSKDKSEEIIRSEYSKDRRIKIITQENQGLGGARNTGICEATGEWILFVDSDDWLKEDAIEILVNKSTEDNSDVVIYNMKYIYENGHVRKRTPQILKDEIISGPEALKRELKGDQYRFHAPNKFCKKELFQNNKVEFPVGKLYEDISTTYKLLASSTIVSLTERSLYFYLQKRNDSITGSRVSQQMFNDLFEAMGEVISFVDKTTNTSEMMEAKQAFYLDNVISFCNYLYKEDSEISKRYYLQMKEDKNWYLLGKLLLNKQLTLEKKIRGILIKNFWWLYASVMNKLRGRK